jgi:pimeloyl-ACP methyl ester carboxylesterase
MRRRHAILWAVVSTMALGCGASSGGAEPEHARSSGDELGPIVDEEVTLELDGRSVHGTLTRPVDASRHAAVLLIAGSGPTDRDWNSPLLPGTNGSGRLLAEALAHGGVVVLRYDKTGTGQSGLPSHPLAWDDYVAEQTAMLAHLRAHPSVDPARVFVAGHSEGGEHAIHLMSHLGDAPPPAGLVLLACPGHSMRDIVYRQLETQFRDAAGYQGEQLAQTMTPIGAALDDIAAGRPVDPAQVSPIPAVQGLVQAFMSPASLPFARAILPFDPAVELRALHVPVLIVNGAHDMQVSAELDAATLERAAREGGNADVTLVVPPLANHVLKLEPLPVAEQNPVVVQSGYSAADRGLDPEVAPTLLAWLARH